MTEDRRGRSRDACGRVLYAPAHASRTADAYVKVIVVGKHAARLLHQLGRAHPRVLLRAGALGVGEQSRAERRRNEQVRDVRLGVADQGVDERPVLRVVEVRARPGRSRSVAATDLPVATQPGRSGT